MEDVIVLLGPPKNSRHMGVELGNEEQGFGAESSRDLGQLPENRLCRVSNSKAAEHVGSAGASPAGNMSSGSPWHQFAERSVEAVLQ